jgi:chitinase
MMTTSSISSLSTTAKETAAFRHFSKPALVGYWHNWHTQATPFIPLKQVSSAFDAIHVAFAVADARHDGSLVFVPCEQINLSEFKSDVAHLQAWGKKVLISVGGANGSLAVNSLLAQQNFVDSLERIVSEYGFDGVDIDLEGTVCLEKGDRELKNPSSASIVYLIEALRDLMHRFDSNFLLSLAPQVAQLQGGYDRYDGLQGAYLPVVEHLRDILNYVHVQHYNALPQKALDGQVYAANGADFHVAMAEMLLAGFPIEMRAENYFAALRPDQVSIGLPVNASIVKSGYAGTMDLEKILASLAGGKSFGGRYVLRNPAGYAGFQHMMLWSINWDAVDGFVFSNAARAYLDATLLYR